MSLINRWFDASHWNGLYDGLTLKKWQVMLLYLTGSNVFEYIPETGAWIISVSVFIILLLKGRRILSVLLQACYNCFIKEGSCFYTN